MLEKIKKLPVVTKEEYRLKSEKVLEKLTALQLQLQQNDIPVIIFIEGLSASGKGYILSKVVLSFDPRFSESYSITAPSCKEEKNYYMKRFWEKIPPKGDIAIFDRSWYRLTLFQNPKETLPDAEFNKILDEIKISERQLTDDGYLIIKLFLHIDKEEQRKRLSNLEKKEATRWRVANCDWEQNNQFEKTLSLTDKMLEKSNFPFARWNIVDASNKKSTVLEVYKILIDEIEKALKANKAMNTPAPPPILENPEKLYNNSKNNIVSGDFYKKELNKYQKKLFKIHNRLYLNQIPVIFLFEGFDAAGKGGAIKRVAASLDGRGYQVNPISAPTEAEKNRHYLWRFYRTLPQKGDIAIYDRSWYGRILVERVEGLCSADDILRAYYEINEFEKSLTDWGAVVIKFFLTVTPDEQLKRFKEREKNPLKRHKITDEDWRNRGKRSEYEQAVYDMLKYTSTDYAKWNVIDGNDKLSARLNIISNIIRVFENKLPTK